LIKDAFKKHEQDMEEAAQVLTLAERKVLLKLLKQLGTFAETRKHAP
jgi:hypothetical protein